MNPPNCPAHRGQIGPWAGLRRRLVGAHARTQRVRVDLWPFVLALALLPGLLPAAAATEPVRWTGTVVHVSDGDTLWVRPHGGGQPRAVRLEGIDAPELCQPHGAQARAALAARLQDRPVQVRVRLHDDYGRALARVEAEGQDVAAWLVRQGHAWAQRYRGRASRYAELEAQARVQRLGLFAQRQPETPRDFRRRHGPCH